MLLASKPRHLTLSLAALVMAAASFVATAVFAADGPGSNLAPVGGADQMIEILQGNQTILWSSLSGSVVAYRVEGWPETIDGNELGGALVIERPVDTDAGVIDFGEKPKSLGFEIDD
jgi:hypothetical protein